MVGYEKYPYFYIDTFKVWILLNQFIHEILSMNISHRFLDIDMDGLEVFATNF